MVVNRKIRNRNDVLRHLPCLTAHLIAESLGYFKPFSVIEYASFFAVRHNSSGDEHPVGDGVDTLFDKHERALSPGTPGFIEAWEDCINADEQGTLEACFPEHLED